MSFPLVSYLNQKPNASLLPVPVSPLCTEFFRCYCRLLMLSAELVLAGVALFLNKKNKNGAATVPATLASRMP